MVDEIIRKLRDTLSLDRLKKFLEDRMKEREIKMNNQDTEDMNELVENILYQLRLSAIVPMKIEAFYESVVPDEYCLPHVTITFSDGTKKSEKDLKVWDKSYNQDAICECSHPYYRHFDTYEEMAPIGCKYCGCSTFKLANTEQKPNENSR